MGHLSWQSLSASGALWRLQAAGTASLWTHPLTASPRCAPWSCPVWLLLALLSTSLDTQSSLPFNTLCKHIKWKFRRARTPKGGSSPPPCAKPQGHPCKVPAFAQRTHFSCDICESKTNFRSGDSIEKSLKGLSGVLLFDVSLPLSLTIPLSFSLCSLPLFFRLCFRFLSQSLRQYASAKKKRKNLKLCSAFFRVFYK